MPNMRNDQVTFYYETLPTGTYDFYFRLRTSIQGRFVHPPAKAENDVQGNCTGALRWDSHYRQTEAEGRRIEAEVGEKKMDKNEAFKQEFQQNKAFYQKSKAEAQSRGAA